MKKLLYLLPFLFFLKAEAAQVKYVQVGTGALQAGTTAGFNVSSGTVQVLNTVNVTSTGTWTLGSTATVTGQWTFKNGVVASTGAISEFSIGSITTLSVARGSGVAFASTTAKTLGQLYLSTGNWTLTGQVGYAITSGNPASSVLAWSISRTSNTLSAASTQANPNSNGEVKGDLFGDALATSSDDDITGSQQSFVTLTTPATFFLVASPAIASGSIEAYGSITAVRR